MNIYYAEKYKKNPENVSYMVFFHYIYAYRFVIIIQFKIEYTFNYNDFNLYT